ncbi:MAG: hypothetical protein JXD18_03465 [Anaerolineae bacterium]|nr:hypothetical protein [Anaerolineae bacterium]
MSARISREMWFVVGVAAIGLAIVVALAWGIWEQVALLRHIQAAEVELAPLVEHEKQRQQALQATFEHVSSAGYPEEWARVYGGMAGAGEVVVIVDLPEASSEPAAPAPVVATDVEQAQPSVWDHFWQWLSGAD